MRKRRWILPFALIVLAIGFLIVHEWRLLGANERIKNYILSELRPAFGDSCDIEQVSMSVSYIHIRGLKLPFWNKRIILHVNDLRIGYNFFRYITKGLDAKAISQDILMQNPRIVYSITDSSKQDDNRTPPNWGIMSPDFSKHYREPLKQLGFLSRVSVIDGEIFLKMSDGSLIQLANSVEGWLATDQYDSMNIRLNGNLFASDRQNLYMDGRADLERGDILYMHTYLNEVLIQNNLPFIPPEFCNAYDGSLNGQLLIKKSDKHFTGFVLNGEAVLKNASARILDDMFIIEQLATSVRFVDWHTYIDSVTAVVNEAKVSGDGQLTDWFKPELMFRFKSDDLSAAKYAHIFGEEWIGELDGQAKGYCTISGESDSLLIGGRLVTDYCRVKSLFFSDASADIDYQDRLMKIRNFIGNLWLANLTGNADVDFSTKPRKISGALQASADYRSFLNTNINARLNRCQAVGSATIHGVLSRPVLKGDLAFLIENHKSDSLLLENDFVLDKTGVDIWAENRQDVKIRVDWQEKEVGLTANITNAQDFIWSLWDVPFAQEEYLINAQVQGTPGKLKLQSDVHKRNGAESPTNFFSVDADVAPHRRNYKVEGRFLLYPGAPHEIPGRFSFRRDGELFVLDNLSVSDQLTALIRIDHTSLSGRCDVRDLQIHRILSPDDSSIVGLVNGEIEFSGSDAEPAFDGQLKFSDGSIGAGGPYLSELKFDYKHPLFSVGSFFLATPDLEIVNAQGGYNIAVDSLDLRIGGDSFEVAEILKMFRVNDNLLTGRTKADLNASGTLMQPRVVGSININNGTLFSIPISEIQVELGEAAETVKIWSAEKTKLNFKKIRIARSNDFTIQGSGYLPFTRDDSLAMNLTGNGNFLSILSDVDEFFTYSSSVGSFASRLKGTLASPVLEAARLEFSQGKMAFETVVPLVTELEGMIKFEPEDQFLHIIALEGLLGDEWFKISNTRSISNLSARPLENLVIGESGVNLGVIVLETTEKGIPLNVTGLMEPNVFGYAQFVGKEKNERFYYAGPYERPVCRGCLNVYDFEFMFPFDENTQVADDNLVLQVLYATEWDVLVMPINDVRYVKALPGALDDVYIDMQLEERFGGLYFSGQWNDDSFRITGEVRSTSGVIEYLDMAFRIDQAGAQFDRNTLIPVVYCQARTTIADSAGLSSQIFLTAQTVDNTLDKKPVDEIARQETTLGRWDEIRFKLRTDKPNQGTTEAQLLASLGYSIETLQSTAFDVIGINTENYLLRPLYRPVERKLERILRFDYVRFSSRFTRNFISFNLNNNPALNTRLALLRSTRLTIGKYLSKSLFLQYTGQVESGIEYRYQEKSVGLQHTLGLEYRISPQLLLELEYSYGSLMMYKYRDDKRIVLRHWFPF